MKEVIPSAQDMKRIYFKLQRRKNLLPDHAVLRGNLNYEVLRLRREAAHQSDPGKKSELTEELLKVLERKRVEDDTFFLSEAKRVRTYMLNQPKTVRLARRRRGEVELNPFDSKRSSVALADRYAASILNRAFKVKPFGRDQIIRTLLNALSITTGSAFAERSIIKLDVRDFFGSIDHDILRRKLEGHAGVPVFVNQHVRAVLQAYKRIHNKSTGIPKGVPSSSVLAEVYMEEFDEYVRQHPRVVLYMRYVDDIVIVLHGRDPSGLALDLERQLAKLNLNKNEEKTRIVIPNGYGAHEFDYLGYSFGFDRVSGQLDRLDISEAKLTRYIAALEKLKTYGDSLRCWHNREDVDLYLAAFEYLFFPHATVGDEDSMRIVTGLAYSARFVLHAGLKHPRFDCLLAAPPRKLRPTIGRLLGKAPTAAVCSCCKRAVHQAEALNTIVKKKLTLRSVLERPAAEHESDSTRERIKGLLWN